ncbi:predicted protein [Thalassiosira pseudonana CCMP1335]|uniref:SAP domain-containing protein n=1 Tax=Thalassiosira pseudonana TaxID=35128 RepID=B8CCT3_THAPS|nr:predicted protein [Thalassiosira pseudonana CCMP1335]EED88831.1 predicted protein [Thalassiosira pseudonana CCMP1335]
MSAPTLAVLCEDADEETTIPIVGVRFEIFQCMLRYAYGDDIPDELWKPTNNRNNSNNNILSSSPAMELLDAANRFGVVGLKILAESKVQQHNISIETASDLILYADAKNCPLLKEKAMDYFVLHAEEIRKSPSFERIEESTHIMVELMDALLSSRRSSTNTLRSFSLGEQDVDYGSMSVNLLRRMLEERGLDVDGSREMLIGRLEGWNVGRNNM